MNTAEENKAQELTVKICNLKKYLTEHNGVMPNRDVHEEILQMGKLLVEKNELTGLNEDAPYLYFNDGEWLREIMGFVGDPLDLEDIHHQPLKVGDTIGFVCEDGKLFPRIVMQGLPSQKIILEKQAAKIKDGSEMDIKDAFAATFTISLHSPIQEYERSLENGMEIRL